MYVNAPLALPELQKAPAVYAEPLVGRLPEEVFELLRTIKAVDSESEFSRDWLGRGECYLRTLRFKKAKPSVATIAICASKLQHYGNQLVHDGKHHWIGERFLTLSQECHAQINQQSMAKWL